MENNKINTVIVGLGFSADFIPIYRFGEVALRPEESYTLNFEV